MNKIFKLMVTALLVCCATVAHAENAMTVFDGNTVSVYVPLPTASYNVQDTRGQVIYPAEALTAMVGQTINGFTLYVNDEGCKMNGGTLRVSMGEVETATFSSKTFFGNLAVVARTEMHVGAFEVDVDFDAPYTYNGGNLVIDFYVEQAGESGAYNFTYFYGLYQQGHSALTTGDEGNEYREFIPKTTFYYGEKDAVAARVNPRAVNFNSIRVGESEEQTLSLKNTGLTAFTPVVTATAPFSATVSQAVVEPGQTAEITVAFEPVAAGSFDGTLLVDCGAGVVLEVPMTGEALETGDELTVCDGTATNNKLPFNGVYFSDAGTYGQMIYPAGMLTEMAGRRIVALSFYTSNPINLKDGTVQLSLKTTDQDEFTSTAAITDMTAVASMALTRGVDVITFEFDTPFEYDGGNLVVEARIIDNKGNYATTMFLGEQTENYAGLSVTHSQWSGDNAERVRFLPKVTFIHQKGAVNPGDVDGNGIVNVTDVTILITALMSENYSTINEANADVDGNGIINVTDVTNLIGVVMASSK